MKKNWKCIKSIASMKSKNSYISSSILSNGKCITESAAIANTFNDFFHSVTPVIQSKIKLSYKLSKDYILSKDFDSFSIVPASRVETGTIMSSLNNSKSKEPNSITLIILKLTGNEISQPLAGTYNL